MSHRKTLILTPSVIYKDDLISLEGLLRQYLPSKGYNFQIRGIEHGHELSAKPCRTMEELFAENNLPKYLDQLIIDIKEVDNKDMLIHSIQVHLDKRVSDIRLFSEIDEIWLNEIYQKLKDFFYQRRPWYWYLGISIPPVFNISLGLALIMSAFIIVSKANQAFIFPFLLVLSGGIYMALGITRVIFRHARICLFKKAEDFRPNYELFALFVHLVILVVSITGTVIMTSGKI